MEKISLHFFTDSILDLQIQFFFLFVMIFSEQPWWLLELDK